MYFVFWADGGAGKSNPYLQVAAAHKDDAPQIVDGLVQVMVRGALALQDDGTNVNELILAAMIKVWILKRNISNTS